MNKWTTAVTYSDQCPIKDIAYTETENDVTTTCIWLPSRASKMIKKTSKWQLFRISTEETAWL